jgi:ribosomal protein S18 acetylase RimI-like enzyme
MRKAQNSDKNLIVDILSKSFNENQSINFVVKQNRKRKDRINLLIQYSFFIGMNFGDVFISDDETSCCIMLLPEKKKTTFFSLLWEVKLLFRCIGISNLMKILNREKLLKQHHPDSPFIHLWYIGVLPEYQGNNKGSLLIEEIITYYKLTNKTIYLETSTLRNLPFYKKHGFKVISKINLSYSLYILKRD